MSALNNASVRRMKKSFSNLSKKELNTIQELTTELSNNNYKKHRELLENSLLYNLL
jgi:hypothetical protein